MEYVIENWVVILGIAALLCVVIGAVIMFLHQPREEQLNKVREWLLWAIVEAEKSYGSGTGKIKLRFVYDQFIMRFPKLSSLISFEAFSMLVDQALEEMRHMLEVNPQAAKIVMEKPVEPVVIVAQEEVK